MKAVVFDLYGTLIDTGDGPARELSAFITQNGRRAGSLAMVTDGLLRSSEANTSQERYASYGRALIQRSGLMVGDDVCEAMGTALDKELRSFSLFPEVVSTLQMLRRQGLIVGLCSNLAEPYADVVDLLDIRQYFDFIVWSFKEGFAKPSKEIFQRVVSSCSKANSAPVLPNEILFCGDSLRSDVEGSSNAGMNSVWINRRHMTNNPSVDYQTLYCLSELRPVIFGLKIRDATPADAHSISEIYDYYVLNEAATFELEPPGQEEIRRRIEETLKSFPYIVCERSGVVVGYAYAGTFRKRAAYNHTVEASCYVSHKHMRLGIGSMLMKSLISRSQEMGFKQMISVITDNPRSVEESQSVLFHRKLGFNFAGKLPAVGIKFDQEYDIVLMNFGLD